MHIQCTIEWQWDREHVVVVVGWHSLTNMLRAVAVDAGDLYIVVQKLGEQHLVLRPNGAENMAPQRVGGGVGVLVVVVVGVSGVRQWWWWW